jgi:hypothetical protein
VSELIRRWLSLDWHDPLVVAFVVVVLAVALWRQWGLVLLAVLVVALGQGLDYLLRHAAFPPGAAATVVAVVYALGAAFLLFLAAARWRDLG